MWKLSITPSDVLIHHGIQGQKWGKRNGPPYPLDASQKSSAERKYRTDKGYKKKKGGLKWSPIFGLYYDRNAARRGKPASEMSNEELQRRINRKQLEQRYNELDEAQIRKGRNEVLSMVRDYATIAGAVATTAGIVKTAYQIKNGKFGK